MVDLTFVELFYKVYTCIFSVLQLTTNKLYYSIFGVGCCELAGHMVVKVAVADRIALYNEVCFTGKMVIKSTFGDGRMPADHLHRSTFVSVLFNKTLCRVVYFSFCSFSLNFSFARCL